MRNFLQNRAQRVIINAVSSSTSEVASGVPLGGLLSGLRLSIYMNELPREISFAQISMNLDDAKLYAAIPHDSAAQAFQSDIEKLQAWCRKWRLKLHAAKLHHIQYNSRSLRGQQSPTYM